MTALMTMQDIDKSFPGVRALRAARLELFPGEIHALMGENGAGKSTLMKILSGICPKDRGEIRMNGEKVEISSPAQARKLGIGIVHQELNLMPDLTVAQNIFIGREPRRGFGILLDETRLNVEAARIFSSLRLKLEPRALVGNLTIARQQMVEIARALSCRLRVLIMDEPTAALNEAEIADLFAIMTSLKAEGVGIIYISHRMDELKRIADRVTVMRDGKTIGTMLASSTPVEKIIAMMVGREIASGRSVPPDPGQAGVMLEVKGLRRGRDIRNVSFTLRKGEILGFAGLMGAGRTEVARAIFGADRRESGEIYLHGRKLTIARPQDAVRAGIGYLSEDRKHFGLALGMDVRNNIALASLSRFSGPIGLLKETAMRVTAQRYIERLAIRTPSDRQAVRLLSGGNQQKIVMAKWLLRGCEVLIFDEPTRGIDVGAKSEIYKLLNALAQEGRGIIMISSELPEILQLSHRIAIMCEGRLTGILPGGASQEEILHLATMRKEMIGDLR